MQCLDDTATSEFVEGSLSPEAEAEIKLHLDACEQCRTLVSEIAKSLRGSGGEEGSADASGEAAFTKGRSIGRYLVERVIGAGGMGVVYVAHDPELDRKVALKLLRANLEAPEAMTQLQRRLSREAKAMARLSHENVVSVYDTGTVDGRVFVAMELVDGVSLSAWLKGAVRPWREILAVYMSAGRGLAAAHRAGLVHRDFKPDNVLVGNDGRVRVTDFGLARPLAGAVSKSAVAARSSARLIEELMGDPSSTRIPVGVRSTASPHAGADQETRADVIAGTPAYMALEQLLGKPADGRSDQFSFCAALYEGLYGVPPFPARSIEELATRIAEGSVRDPPVDSRVPAWLLRVLLRGLSPLPSGRYPSMAELLEALERRAWHLQRRIIVLIAVATTLLAGAIGYRLAFRQRAAVCGGAVAKLDGVWDTKRREEAKVAFAAAGTPYAADAWIATSRLLDAYTARWAAMRTDACEATRVRGEQSEELLDLRVACLDDRLRRVDALAKLFTTADPKVVEKSVEAAQSLPSLEACANAAALRSGLRPPEDARTAERVTKLRAVLAEVSALDRGGKYKEALEGATGALKEARELQYLPVEAEALYQQGIAQGDLDDTRSAEATLEEAATVAEASSHHEIAALAWMDLAYFVGYEEAHFDKGDRWLRYAATAIERTGGDENLEATRLERLGLLQWSEGKTAAARENLERARALFEKNLGAKHIEVAKTLDAIGLVDSDEGRYDEAVDLQHRAVVIDEEAFGPFHPSLALALNNWANSLTKLGRNAEALAAVRRAADIFERAGGPEHPNLYVPLDTEGTILIAMGELAEADAVLQRARSLLEKAGKTAHPDYAQVLDDIGELDRERGAYASALANHRRALVVGEAALGAEHPDVAMTHFDIGLALFEQGKLKEAAEEHAKALSVVDSPDGAHRAKAASVLMGLGEAELGMHDLPKARAALERAILLRDKLVGEQGDLARTRFALARALWEGSDEPTKDRARSLASQARQAYARDAASKASLDRVDVWLTGHGGPVAGSVDGGR